MDSEAAGVGTTLDSSSTFLPGGEYEVFLSFRGPDTRYAFADFLYTDLKGVGVRTFRDDNELRKGEEIGPDLLKAIMESKICIPIFSENYASSKWCLHELTKMVECKRTTKQLILPIFYDVEPANVRHQSGSYKEAFCEHKKSGKFDDGTMEQWKEALREAGAMKGWEVRREADGYQGQLIKEKIVPAVLLQLKKNYKVISDNLVGIDHHENEIMKLLDHVNNDVRIVGIHGMAGIGKTTIAKYIYNKLFESFECHTFLANIRETTEQHKGLVSLQKQFLNDTLNLRCDHIKDVDSGINEIKDKFLKKNVLIVLDDVNERSHFDWLVGKRDWYGKGSIIIVTTRDKHVLNALQVDGTYEPRFLDFMQSLQLFSIHAFRMKFPPEDFDSISREVTSRAAGLPLTLEVIGSLLFDKEKVVWEETLKKLKRIPNDQVQKKLRISYDALNYEQQQIFLDIACFFIGVDKKYVFYMWDDCGYHPEKEINVLCLMSLVKMEDDNVLRMHDQLRDVGKEIVRQENFKKPGKRSRLWDQEEVLYVLKCQRGKEEVEALILDFDDEELDCQHHFTNTEFTKLFNLRFLQADRIHLIGDFKHLLSRLRWLCWYGCPRDFKNLVILDLSYSMITEDWEGWSQIKVAKKLKVLILSYCALKETPNFSTYGNLEILILRNCYDLIIIGSSIGNLKNLKELNISQCVKLEKLPDKIWTLEKLEVIDASDCHCLEGHIPSNMGRLSSLRFLSFFATKLQGLPTSIGELTNLQNLNLQWHTEGQLLPELPSSLKTLQVASCILNVANLVNLKELHLHRKVKLVEFTIGIRKLSKLETLHIQYSNITALPEEISGLSQLKVLKIEFCEDLQYIYGLPSSLVELSLRVCKSFKRLPDLSDLKILSKLLFKRCGKLTELQGLGKLVSLTSLEIADCIKLADLKGLGKLGSLISLDIARSNKLVEIDLLEGLAFLPSSEMSKSKYPEKESYLSSLKKLQTLNVFSCPNLQKIQGLDKLESLERLNLVDCRFLVILPTLSNLQNLKRLTISNCPEIDEILGLENLKILHYLDLIGCRAILRLPNLSNLKMLRILLVEGCEQLPKIEGLETLKFFEKLNVSGCKSLEEIPDLPEANIINWDSEELMLT